MNFARTGELTTEAGEIIGPSLRFEGLDRMKLRSEGEVRLSPGASVFSVRTRIEERAVFMAATFAGEDLASLELVLLDEPGSGGYGEQDKLKAAHEQWLESMGVVLKPMPFVLDGKPILPASIEPGHLQHSVAAWGEVVSMIDPKNGGASVVVRYTQTGMRGL